MFRANNPAPATDAILPSVSRRSFFAAPQVREKYLTVALFVLALAALFAPALPAAGWHIPHFVDTRAWLGVGSGLIFALVILNQLAAALMISPCLR